MNPAATLPEVISIKGFRVLSGQRCRKLDIHPVDHVPNGNLFVDLLVLGASSLQSTSQRTPFTDQSFATAAEELASFATWQRIRCFYTCHGMQDFRKPWGSLLSVLLRALG